MSDSVRPEGFLSEGTLRVGTDSYGGESLYNLEHFLDSLAAGEFHFEPARPVDPESKNLLAQLELTPCYDRPILPSLCEKRGEGRRLPTGLSTRRVVDDSSRGEFYDEKQNHIGISVSPRTSPMHRL